jgi:hypothetical protein
MFYRTRHGSIRTFASSSVSNTSQSNSPSLSLPLNDSMDPFSHGYPGAMDRVVTPTRPSHSRTAFAVNSGPLSLRMGSAWCQKIIFRSRSK